MATNNFNSDGENEALVPLRTFSDGSGLARLDNVNLSSYTFDGAVPDTTINIVAASITPGMKISFTGSALGETFYRVLSNTNSNLDFEVNETGEVLIEYLDLEKNIQSITASVSDIFSVNYEDWNNKYLGTKGWYLSNDGNAIFSNVAVRGRIEATDGKIEDLTIGSNSYSIVNIVGVDIPSASVTGERGSFILTTNLDQKLFYPGDNGKFENVISSGSFFQLGPGNISSSTFFSEKSIFYVVAASYNFSGAFNRYYCNVSETGLMTMRNLGGLTASSGTYTFGPMEFGEIQTYSLTQSDTIEGFIFKTVGPGTFWDSYIPDYLDVSGRFRLGGGKVTFDGVNLNVIGNINATSGSFTGWLKSASITGSLITSGSAFGGILQTPVYIGVTDGSAFSTKGTNINLNNGSITSGQFRIDSLGNATFAGSLSAATGTIGGFTIASNALNATNITLSSSGGLRLGPSNQLSIDTSGNLRAISASISGNINATGGQISGNLSIGGSLTASNNSNQFIVSSSGIFGSGASGTFNLNSISGGITTNSIRINSNRVVTASSFPGAYAVFEEGGLIGVTSNFGLDLYHDIINTWSGSSINYSFYGGKWNTLAYVPGYSGRSESSNPILATYFSNPTMRVGSINTSPAEILLRNYAQAYSKPPVVGVPGESSMGLFADTYYLNGGAGLYIGAPIDDAVSELINGSFFNMYTDEVSASTYTFFQATTDFLGTPDFKFKLRADGRGYADGAWTTPAADYAEYFEWEDENINNEDRRGVTVILVNEKIKIAESTDNLNDIIGVVSSNPGVIGDSAWNHWHQKYLRDEYGSFIYESHTTVRWSAVENNDEGRPQKKNYFYYLDDIPEDVIVPGYAIYKEVLKKTLNPEFNPNDNYIPREERKEWAIIGLLGKVRVRSDQFKNPSWKFLKPISNNVEEWFIK